ncbi:alpha subunit [Phytophthora cinnamomi]|uniref:alpha subunit n=1 Tax=Phytophthora cinnamomi TaxID=4785 RepID=UPI00355988EE|nr:alpha subunit [Phytophthora cinnamomi]
MADVVEAGADGAFDASSSSCSSSSPSARAEALRQQGNAAFKLRQFREAEALYSQALALQPAAHVLYGNRSAAFHQLGDFRAALQDADRAVQLAPDWAKAHLRRAAACESLQRWAEAAAAYEQVLRLADASPEARKAVARLRVIRGKNAVKKGFLSSENAAKTASIYREKEDLDDSRRSWKLMLKKLLDGCNRRGVNSHGQSVVLDDGVFAKLLSEDEFQRLIYPGIPKEQLAHAPRNLQTLLEDPWYEQELLAVMPKVQAKAASVLRNVKKRGAEQGDVMDPATERMLMPQVLQEAFGREVLAMVHRVNFQKHVKLANDAKLLADPNSDFATWDQLDDEFLDELLVEKSDVQGAAVLDEFMGDEWTQLLLNDVFRMAKNGLLMTTASNVDAKHVLSRRSAGNQTETLPGAKLRFVEHKDCTAEYPALAELIEKLHALPYEINKKRPDKARLCAQFVHCTAVQQLPGAHHQPLRLDCGSGDKDNGFKLTCVYFFNAIGSQDVEREQTTLNLRTSLAETAPVRQIAPKPDRLVVFKSQTVLNEITAVPEGQDLFYITFWIHGQGLQ